jgi:hypothetical protein
VGEYWEMTDVVTPGFHAKKKRGEVVFSPMTSIHTKATMTLGSATYRKKTNGINCSGVYHDIGSKADVSGFLPDYCSAVGFTQGACLVAPLLISEVDKHNLSADLMTRVLSNVGKSKLNLGEDWAEIDKSLRLLSDLFSDLRKILTNPNFLTKAKSAANIWLLTRYGLKPLINDIFDALLALEKDVGRQRVTTRARDSISQSSVRTVTKASATVTHYIREEVTDDLEYRVMSLNEYTISTGFNLGFGLKNLGLLAWELIPFSFVIDWFVNIGEYIGSLVPAIDAQQLGSCYVLHRNYSMRITALDEIPISGWTSVSKDTGEYLFARTIKQRVVNMPGPRLHLQSDFKLTERNRCLDALSLVVQRLPVLQSVWPNGSLRAKAITISGLHRGSDVKQTHI